MIRSGRLASPFFHLIPPGEGGCAKSGATFLHGATYSRTIPTTSSYHIVRCQKDVSNYRPGRHQGFPLLPRRVH